MAFEFREESEDESDSIRGNVELASSEIGQDNAKREKHKEHTNQISAPFPLI
jgi:hypothetical protein